MARHRLRPGGQRGSAEAPLQASQRPAGGITRYAPQAVHHRRRPRAAKVAHRHGAGLLHLGDHGPGALGGRGGRQPPSGIGSKKRGVRHGHLGVAG